MKSFDKWAILDESLRDVTQLRAALRSDSNWLFAGEVAGDLLHTVNITAAALQTVIDLATLGSAGAASELGQAVTHRTVEAIKRTGTAIEVVQAQTDEQVAKAIMKEVPVIGSALGFVESLKQANEFSDLSTAARRDMDAQLAAVERQLRKAATEERNAKSRAIGQNGIKEVIDKLCGSTKPPREMLTPITAPVQSVPSQVTNDLLPKKDTECKITEDTNKFKEMSNDPAGTQKLEELIRRCRQ